MNLCRVVSKSDIQIALHIELTNGTASCGCWEEEFRQQVDLADILNELHITQGVYGEGLQCSVAFFCRRTAAYVISVISLSHLSLHTANFHIYERQI